MPKTQDRSQALREVTNRAQILCRYINFTNRLQVIRIENIPSFHLERIIFPREYLIFKANSEAILQVFSCEYIGTMLSDLIPCLKLNVLKSSA